MENEPEMPDLSVSADVAADPSLIAAKPDGETAGPLDDPENPVAQTVGDTAAQSPPPPPAAPAAAKKGGESWFETVKTIFYALLIALVIRTLFFQPFNIPSGSMENTLLVGDYLFVEKFAYGYSRNSFPFRGWPIGDFFHGRLFGSEPARGDVVVFKMPNPNSKDYNQDFIKLVIGLPGDRVQMIDGVLYINAKAVKKERVADYVGPDQFGVVRPIERYRETLPNGKSYYVLDAFKDSSEDNTRLFVVPKGHYFMMGDNRDNSTDSRFSVGYVPSENLVGRANIIFFSIAEGASPLEVWKWPTQLRASRLFTFVH